MILEKFVTDGLTLFMRPDILDRFKNCVFYIPQSNLVTLTNNIGKVLQDESLEDEAKYYFYSQYENFYNTLEILERKDDGRSTESEPVLYDKQNNIYISLVHDLEDRGINCDKINNENYEYITKNYYDVINASEYEDAQIITCDKDLQDLMEDLQIEIFILKINEKAQ